MLYNEGKSVVTSETNPVVLCWDGLNNPETRNDGSISYNVKFLMDPQSPELAELNQIATNVANNRKNLPSGQWQQNWKWPLNSYADVAKFGQEYSGYLHIGGSTKSLPTVVDANNNILEPMHWKPMLYPGAKIQLVLNAFDYNNQNKGIGFGIEGVKIIDTSAPKLPVASGMSQGQVVSAFGGPGTAPGGPGGQMPGTAPGGPGPGASISGPAPKVMLPAANGFSYESYIASGWTDEALIREGLMQG